MSFSEVSFSDPMPAYTPEEQRRIRACDTFFYLMPVGGKVSFRQLNGGGTRALITGEYRFHGMDSVTLEIREPPIQGLSLDVRVLLKDTSTRAFRLVEIDPETLSRE